MRPKPSLLLAGLVAGVIALSAMPVSAQEWTQPYAGVRYLYRDGTYPYDAHPRYQAHVLEVDLTHPAVSLHATPPGQAGGVVSAFAERNGYELAWNTNFFSNTSTPCGMAMGDGQLWTNAYAECEHSLGIGAQNEVEIFSQSDPLSPPQGWMREIVSGTPSLVVDNGAPVYSYGCGTACAYNPRVGVGFNADRTRLIMVLVDGRSATSAGAGLDDLGNLLVEFGAHRAINLDGGGSAALYIANRGGVVNQPSDGAQRPVCCHMGVDIDEGQRWYAAEVVATSEVPALRSGEASALWAELRNVGRRPWTAGGEHPVRLGTIDPTDRPSPFATGAWINDHRPVEAGALVAPGSTARFDFPILPPAAGAFTERFALVAEGAAWMDDATVTFELPVEGGASNNEGANNAVTNNWTNDNNGTAGNNEISSNNEMINNNDITPNNGTIENNGATNNGTVGNNGTDGAGSPTSPTRTATTNEGCQSAPTRPGGGGDALWLLAGLIGFTLRTSRRRIHS